MLQMGNTLTACHKPYAVSFYLVIRMMVRSEFVVLYYFVFKTIFSYFFFLVLKFVYFILFGFRSSLSFWIEYPVHFCLCLIFVAKALAVYFWPMFLFPGNEEVKLAILSALGSWAARSADAVQSNLVSFFSSGIKEKEALRRGHLRCLRAICKNTDAVFRVSWLIKLYLSVLWFTWSWPSYLFHPLLTF